MNSVDYVTADNLVIYDADPDGFGCAYAAWTALGDDPTFVHYEEVLHGTAEPSVLSWKRYKNVYIFDLSFSREVLEYAKAVHGNVVVIDHHPSAEEVITDLGLNPVPFDTTRAACVQVWEYFHNSKPPLLLQYVADRDTWAWELPHSEAVNNWIFIQEVDFEEWDIAARVLEDEDTRVQAMREGYSIQSYKATLVQDIANSAELHPAKIAGDEFEVPLAYANVLHSEVGHELLNRYPDAPFSITYSDNGTHRKYSLRSEDHRLDVGELAKRLGGGGHHNAAGYSTSLQRVWEAQRDLYDGTLPLER